MIEHIPIQITAEIETLKSIRGSLHVGAILVDATVPLEIAAGGHLSRTLTLWDGSAAQQAARLLPGIAVVSAFHSLSAEALGLWLPKTPSHLKTQRLRSFVKSWVLPQ